MRPTHYVYLDFNFDHCFESYLIVDIIKDSLINSLDSVKEIERAYACAMTTHRGVL